jgi:hypothetical protein
MGCGVGDPPCTVYKFIHNYKKTKVLSKRIPSNIPPQHSPLTTLPSADTRTHISQQLETCSVYRDPRVRRGISGEAKSRD